MAHLWLIHGSIVAPPWLNSWLIYGTIMAHSWLIHGSCKIELPTEKNHGSIMAPGISGLFISRREITMAHSRKKSKILWSHEEPWLSHGSFFQWISRQWLIFWAMIVPQMSHELSHEWAINEPWLRHKWAMNWAMMKPWQSHEWAINEPCMSHKWAMVVPWLSFDKRKKFL